MHLADLKSYLEADQRLTALHTDRDAWTRKAILNVAGSGKFSSDHTVAQYATEIWQAKPCPVALSRSPHLASCREVEPETPALASGAGRDPNRDARLTSVSRASVASSQTASTATSAGLYFVRISGSCA